MIDNAPKVRPWKALVKPTRPVLPRSAPQRRAILRAPSIASVPLLLKKTRAMPVFCSSSSASRTCGSWAK